jgi:hypothetical protein
MINQGRIRDPPASGTRFRRSRGPRGRRAGRGYRPTGRPPTVTGAQAPQFFPGSSRSKICCHRPRPPARAPAATRAPRRPGLPGPPGASRAAAPGDLITWPVPDRPHTAVSVAFMIPPGGGAAVPGISWPPPHLIAAPWTGDAPAMQTAWRHPAPMRRPRWPRTGSATPAGTGRRPGAVIATGAAGSIASGHLGQRHRGGLARWSRPVRS